MNNLHTIIAIGGSELTEIESHMRYQDATITILRGFTDSYLDLFEQMFESDESVFDGNPDRLQHYIMTAIFMSSKYGRPHIAERVEERLKSLPF